MQVQIQLPKSFIRLISSLSDVFHKPTFPYFVDYIKGILISPKKQVTRFFLLGTLMKHFTSYHRFLNHARWDTKLLAFRFLELLIKALCLKEIVFALDDTLTPKYGVHIYGRSLHFNHAAKPNLPSYIHGHNWIICGLLHHVSVFSKWICFPFMNRLYIPQSSLDTSVDYRSKIQIASDMLRDIHGYLKRPFTVVADALYAKKEFIQTCVSLNCPLISRLRQDAALYEPVKQTSGKKRRGRPRILGKRLGALRALAKHTASFKNLQVSCYQKLRILPVREVIAYWKPAGGLIKILIVRYSTKRSQTVNFFFTPDLTMSAERMITLIAARWSLENAFKDMKQHLGFNDWQCRKADAVVRSTQLTSLAYSSLLLWSLEELKQEQLELWDPLPWQNNKGYVSLQDLLEQLKNKCLSDNILWVLRDLPINNKKYDQIKRLFRLVV